MSAAGVTLEVVGPRGVLGRFGAGIDSRLGHLLTGSPAVDVRGAAVATWRPQPRVVGIAAAGVALVAVAVAGLRTRRG